MYLESTGGGPFPALIDMYGGIVTLIETRAALLASHGYATFALSYLYGEGLPQTLLSADLEYLQVNNIDIFRALDKGHIHFLKSLFDNKTICN